MTISNMSPTAMAALYARCFPQRPWSETEIVDLIARRDVITLFAPNGFLMASQITPESEILTIAVDPDARRCGTGRALVTLLFETCANHAVSSVFLDVAEGNTAARGLYQHMGFVETGRRKAYYGHGDEPRQDAILMRCDLSPGQSRKIGKKPPK